MSPSRCQLECLQHACWATQIMPLHNYLTASSSWKLEWIHLQLATALLSNNCA